MAAVFAGMVLNQTQMTLMLLGRVPHPQTGEKVVDLNGARMLIDQLEMLDSKTRGNLDEQETRMLRDSLTGLRMAFVEAANTQPGGSSRSQADQATSAPPRETTGPAVDSSAEGGPAQSPGATPDAESRKKFTKKY